MRRSRSLTATTLLAAALQVACGDSTGSSGDQLTQQETAAVFTAVTIAFSEALSNINFSSPATAALGEVSQVPFEGSVNGSTACTLGGTITFQASYSGDYDGETTDFEYEYDMVFNFNACRLQANDISFTVTGDPNLTISGDYEGSGQSFTFTYSQEGGFAFVADDGRTGSCQMDYTVTSTFNGSQASTSYNGSICGTDLSGFST